MGAAEQEATGETASESPAQSFRRICLEHLSAVAEGFYRDNGVDVEAVERAVETQRRIDLPIGATIGFVGDSVRGTLAISPDNAIAAHSYPNGEPSDEALADWVGESANQVLGRLKNRLLAHGVEVICDTPIIVSGQARLGGIRREVFRITCGGSVGAVNIWLDAQVDDDIDMSTPLEDAAEEGELVLF